MRTSLRLFARLALVASSVVVASACDDAEEVAGADADVDAGADTGVSEGAVTYYTDVKPLLDGYCVRCHVEGGVAPMALDSFEAASQWAPQIAAAVQARTMPPFLAAPAVRPLMFDASLSDTQIDTFVAWAEAEAPMGNVANPGAAVDVELARLSRVDLTIEMPETYTPSEPPDEYRCFVIDWPREETSYITGMNVRPGNLAIAHHAVSYLIDPAYAEIVDSADGADGRPGYPCFGGATPPGTESFPTKIVSAWVPGEGGLDFPPGTGVRVLPGSRIILQMHYSIAAAGPQPDLTAVDFSVADEVEIPGGNLPFLDTNWPGDPVSMLIPAGESSVIHGFEGDPTESGLLRAFSPGVDPSQGIWLHSVLPHLHTLGRRIMLEVRRADGTVEPLVSIPRWDFNWQSYFHFAEPVLVNPGDRLYIECEWDNSPANQPVFDGELRAPQDVTWGEGTYDEMCASSIYITGVFNGETECSDFGSVPSDVGRFDITFEAVSGVRESTRLDGPLTGTFYGSIFRAEDVVLTGPLPGREAVLSLRYELDLTDGPDGVFLAPDELPAGDYSILGFLDIDGNADPDNADADVNDPVVIPGTVFTLACAEQPITAEFALLRP